MLQWWPEQVTQNDSGVCLEQNAINKCMSKNAQYITIWRLLHKLNLWETCMRYTVHVCLHEWVNSPELSWHLTNMLASSKQICTKQRRCAYKAATTSQQPVDVISLRAITHTLPPVCAVSAHLVPVLWIQLEVLTDIACNITVALPCCKVQHGAATLILVMYLCPKPGSQKLDHLQLSTLCSLV